jgi:hypothetical protein
MESYIALLIKLLRGKLGVEYLLLFRNMYKKKLKEMKLFGFIYNKKYKVNRKGSWSLLRYSST